MTLLPGILAEIAECVGTDAALALARIAGGRAVYIPAPHNLTSRHWLVKALGMAQAVAVATIFGGGEIRVPLGPTGSQASQRAMIDSLIAQGLSTSQVASRAGVTERTVERRRAALRDAANDNQLSLF